jgi:CheY-like chemotaxis protein
MMQKILVVDDEQIMQRLMQHHLTRAGFQMLVANNGREALEVAGRETPALIVMDIMMAEMDGLTALKELKKNEATKSIPVIVITANSHHVTRQEAENSGAIAFMTKPFSPTQLLIEIRRLLPENKES